MVIRGTRADYVRGDALGRLQEMKPIEVKVIAGVILVFLAIAWYAPQVAAICGW